MLCWPGVGLSRAEVVLSWEREGVDGREEEEGNSPSSLACPRLQLFESRGSIPLSFSYRDSATTRAAKRGCSLHKDRRRGYKKGGGKSKGRKQGAGARTYGKGGQSEANSNDENDERRTKVKANGRLPLVRILGRMVHHLAPPSSIRARWPHGRLREPPPLPPPLPLLRIILALVPRVPVPSFRAIRVRSHVRIQVGRGVLLRRSERQWVGVRFGRGIDDSVRESGGTGRRARRGELGRLEDRGKVERGRARDELRRSDGGVRGGRRGWVVRLTRRVLRVRLFGVRGEAIERARGGGAGLRNDRVDVEGGAIDGSRVRSRLRRNNV